MSRVVGQDPSAILGSLWSNGRVFLANPNGIVFGAGSQVDVAGLVATSLNLSNSDFLAGRLNFTAVQGAGGVVNQGNITTGTGGSVYLVGPAVTNSGIITTPQGEVVLAAGNSVELVNPGTPNLSVEISAPDNEARNLGQIIADAGRIGIYAGLITNSGTIRADSAVSEGGRILLKGTKSVTLEDTSVLSAQGRGGGEILVLADESVRVAGRLDASAPNGGDGGFIETSASKVTRDPSAVITTAAPHGKTGTWLIDPYNYHIAPSGGDTTGSQLSSDLGANNITITSDGTVDFPEFGGGNIYVDDTVVWTSNNSLTLIARSDVNVNQYLTTTGTGSIKLYAGWDGASTSSPAVPNYGTIYIGAPVSVSTTAGNVHLVSGGYITQTAGGVITANGLLADGRYGVQLDGATNMVNTVAGRAAEGDFYFTNGKSLIVGTVGGVSGITAGPGCCDANVSVTVTSGDLTVNNNITANGGNSDGIGDADINLVTQNGSIIVQNGAVVSAKGADVPAEGSGSGGDADVTLYAQNGSITVTGGSRIEAIGGQGQGGETGDAYVYFYAGLTPTSNISVSSGSNVSADGAEGSIYFNATNISVLDSTLNATGDGTRTVCCGSQVELSAGGIIDTSGSTLSAVDAAGDGYVYLHAPGNITLGHLITDTLGSVYVNAGGSILDGNTTGLNVQSPFADLRAATGIGTVANSLETLVGSIFLYNTTSGEVGVINSDILNNLNLYHGGTGNAAVGATGTMRVGSAYSGGNLSLIANGMEVYGNANSGGTMVLNSQSGTLNISLDGGEGLTANNLNLLGANINIGNASNISPAFVYVSSVLSVSTPGNFKVLGGSGQSASTYVVGGAGVSVVAGGNVVVEGGTNPGAYAQLIGSPDVYITAGGTVSVNPGNAFATIESGLPATIYLNFPNNTVGDGTLDFSVAGVTSAIVDGKGTSGFFAGGSMAILDVNLIVTPRGGVPAVPPSPIPEAILELPPPAPTQIHDPIVGESGQSTGASQSSDSTQEAAQSGGSGQLPEKDDKKKVAVCS